MGALPAHLLLDPDPLRLERALADGIREHKRRAPLAPILVLAPSSRLVRRLREALAGEAGPLVGVEVLTFTALAARLASAAGTPLPRLAPRSLREEIARGLAGEEDSGLGRYVRPRPAAVAHLVGALDELREAGIPPEKVAAAARGPRERDLAAFFARYERALDALAGAGWSDRAAWVRRATPPHASVTRYRAVYVAGASEIIGANLALLRSLAPADGVRFLVPADPEAPAWTYARRFLERHLPLPRTALESPEPSRPHVLLARALRDPSAGPGGALPVPRLVHAQGPEAELTLAAREALSLLAGGVPPEEIGIVARTLDPYAAHAEAVFARHGLPVDSSAGLSLLRWPKPRAFLLLVEALGRDFERQTLLDLLRSPHLVRPGDASWSPDRWDRWSRRFHLVRGAETWIEDLPRAVERARPPREVREDPAELDAFARRHEEEEASAAALACFVRELAEERAAWQGCRTAAEHGRFLRDLAARRIVDWGRTIEGAGPEETEQNRVLQESLDELEALDAARRAVPGRNGATTIREVLEFLELTLGEAEIPWSVPGGVRFLDVMQARGLTFRHLFLIGCNADLLPRRSRESAFLPDRLRRALREERSPLPVAAESPDEEWMLLAQTVASARESLTLTWQRADADGRAKPASLALREVARLRPGSPSLELLLSEAAERLPTHPAEAGAWLAARTGLASREEAALYACGRRGDAVAALAEFLAAHEPGTASRVAGNLDMVRALQEFGPGSLRYDGRIPDMPPRPRPFSATSLERLGRCPQTYFFRDALRVHPLEETSEDRSLEMDEVGNVFHALLDAIATDLHREGLLDGAADGETLLAAARASLDRRWEEGTADAARRMRRHLPALWAGVAAVWREELERFLEADLRRLAEGGHALVGSEMTVDAVEIDLGRGAALAGEAGLEDQAEAKLTATGRLDRVTRDRAGRLLVSDYKTMGNLKKRVHPSEFLKGARVQLPLYLLLVAGRDGGSEAAAEFLGIGPSFRPDKGFARGEEARLDARTLRKHRDGFEETLAVLAGSARGRFPFHPDFHCTWCAFRPACRRFHYPSSERQRNHFEFAAYQAMVRKGVKKPALARVLSAGKASS